MQKISKIKFITSILFTIIAIICVIPNFSDQKHKWLPDTVVNLGLDLRGGAHLLMDVDFENYIEEVTQSMADSVKKSLRDQKIGYKNLISGKNNIKFDLRSEGSKFEDDYKKIKKLIYSFDPDLTVTKNNNSIVLLYDETAIDKLRDKVIDQSIEIIRMRIDSSGTKEPIIQRQGSQHILLQVPGEEDPAQLKNVLGKTAKLTFHLVDESANLERAAAGQVPAGSKLVTRDGSSALVIKKKVIVSGDQLNNAQASFNRDSVPVVHFSFNPVGAKKFAEVTSNNKGKRLAIILDGRLLSEPVINEPILGGDGIISGNFTIDSANELALLLRAGALPAPLKVIEERSIGPNLGSDSIESGKKAALIGFVFVVVFMLLAYGMLGVFASIALVLALLYIFALMSILQATLTLPGIAGIVLTIGMAVDANVLIYERIREESLKGCSNLYAVKLGFESALATITDSNITTLIAAFLLYIFGVGAIKGFAVTLTVGIIASMFTALVITKLMIDLWLKFIKPKSLGL